MEQDKTKLGIVFGKQFKKAIQKIDICGAKSNKEFAIEIGISESLFSKYYNNPILPETFEYIKICNYFKKNIPNFNEDFLIDDTESMIKENSVIVKTFRANEDLSVALYDLKEFHNILTSIFTNTLAKQFLQNTTDLCGEIEKNILSLVTDWENSNKKIKQNIIFLIKDFINQFNYEELKLKIFVDLQNILYKLALDTIINTLKDIVNKETESHKQLIGDKNIKEFYNFLKDNYKAILDIKT